MTAEFAPLSAAEATEFETRLAAQDSYLKKFAASLSSSDAMTAEIVKETRARALANWHQCVPGVDLRAWLTTIAREAFLSVYRTKKEVHTRKIAPPDLLAFCKSLFEKDTDAEHEEVLRCLAHLPRYLSDVLIVLGYLGLGFDEASLMFEKEVDVLRSTVIQARKKYQECAQEKNWGDVDFIKFRRATRATPEEHPYYPIAQAYEELFADMVEVHEETPEDISQEDAELDAAWEELLKAELLDGEDVDWRSELADEI